MKSSFGESTRYLVVTVDDYPNPIERFLFFFDEESKTWNCHRHYGSWSSYCLDVSKDSQFMDWLPEVTR